MPKKTERGAEATPRVDSTTQERAAQLKTMHKRVERILRESPATRSSDRALITAVYDDYYGVINQPFWKVMANNELPSFETITRCRRKIQEQDESLRGTKKVEEARIDKQIDFLEYAAM